MPIEDALNELSIEVPRSTKRGPKGGILDKPEDHPEWRQAHFEPGEAPDGIPGLHRFQRPESAVPGQLKEMPWHRMAAYLLLAGRSNEQVADAAGVTAQAVSNLKSNVWFQELLATLSAAQGEEIMATIKSEALASVNTIVAIRDDETVPARTRLDAAKTLVEQTVGKPTQKIQTDATVRSYRTPEEEMADINAQLAALRKRNTSV